jgi:hypothetical protein
MAKRARRPQPRALANLLPNAFGAMMIVGPNYHY